jgi:hypothetical protein
MQAFAVHEKEITIGINWELTHLALDHLQRREDHSAIVDLVAKGGHIRTVAIPDWVKHTVDQWLSVTEVTHGRIFRRNNVSPLYGSKEGLGKENDVRFLAFLELTLAWKIKSTLGLFFSVALRQQK